MLPRIEGCMKRVLLCIFALLTLIGCTPERRSPDAIREDTAKATSEAARDAKAVVHGVVDGLKQTGPLNINKASEDDLRSLPGIDEATARRIVEGRPYESSAELTRKHLISRAEYDRIADKIVAR